MASSLVDFKAIKQAVTIEQVLSHYQVNWLRRKGEELRGRCPIHQGEGQEAFHANTSKNNFNCFSCGKHGNVLDFVAAMEQCSVRDAAVKIQQWFSVSAPVTDQQKHAPAKQTPKTEAQSGEEERRKPEQQPAVA